jgi:general stress protein 26
MRRDRFRRAPKTGGLSFLALLALASLVSGVRPLAAQTTPARDTLLVAAREIMQAARYCALVTLDESGAPRARTMDSFSPGPDMTVWLGTNRHTRKVRQIEADPRVALYYAAPDASGYVTLLGRARLVDDEAEKAARWKPEWEAFYPDRASDYLLIEVVPERIEIVDYGRGIVGDPDTWEPPSITFP